MMIDESEKSQADKLKDAARALERDDAPRRFHARVVTLTKHEPVEGPE